MTDIEIAGNLPDCTMMHAKSVRPTEPRDGSWVRWKIAQELRWMRRFGVLTKDGRLNPHIWKALVRTKLLAVAIGRGKDTTAKASDANVATYLVVESSMNRTTKNSVIGVELIAGRARVSARSVSDANWRIHQLGLWRMSERHKIDGKWTSNRYDFREAKDIDVLGHDSVTLLHATTLIVKPQKFVRDVERKNDDEGVVVEKKAITSRAPARMIVLVWVLNQIVLTQASASFTLSELVNGTGLQRRAAKSALNSLLEDGTLVKIGDGIVSLPEALSRTHSRTKLDGPFWSAESLGRDHPAFNKRRPKILPQAADGSVLETADGDVPEPSHAEYETAYGVLETADGAVSETADGLPETSYGVLETADKPLVFTSLAERPEEINPPHRRSPADWLMQCNDEPLSPQVRSGEPSLPAGPTDDDDRPDLDLDSAGLGMAGFEDDWTPADEIEAAVHAILEEVPDSTDPDDEALARQKALNAIGELIGRSPDRDIPLRSFGYEPVNGWTGAYAQRLGPQGAAAARRVAPNTDRNRQDARKVFEAVREFGGGPFHPHEILNHGIAVPMIEKFIEIGATSEALIDTARQIIEAWRTEGRSGMRWRDLKPGLVRSFGMPSYATAKSREVFINVRR